MKKKVYLNIKFVVDERAADGFIYAVGMKAFKKYVMKPELLLVPPERIEQDKIDR